MTDGKHNVLECRGIVRQFREGDSVLEVLRGVDLEVAREEIVAVLGTIAGRTFYGERPAELRQMAGTTMGTTWTLKVVLPQGAPGAWVNAIGDTVQSRLDRIEGLMSTWDSTSELSRFNRSSTTGATPLSPETVAVLEIAAEVGERSGGAFDITVAPLVSAWGFGPPGRPSSPSAEPHRRMPRS